MYLWLVIPKTLFVQRPGGVKWPVIQVIIAIEGRSKIQAAGEVAVNNANAGTQVFLFKRLFIIYQQPFAHNAHNRLTTEASHIK